MRIEVIHGDATAIDGDVLALKYAQARYGLDSHVTDLLREAGHSEFELTPERHGFRLLPKVNGLTAKMILYVGVEPLWAFEYQQIRVFARKILSILADQLPQARRLIVTVHGPGFGLDEDEAFESQLAGFLDALVADDAPKMLERITFVERNTGRAARLEAKLKQMFPSGELAERNSDLLFTTGPETRERLRSAGYASASKSHVFVAMPFSDEFEDVYHYGIRNAVKRAKLLCERSDLSSYTGDVIAWVRNRIRTSLLVIADLSGANPNVYLEVGYAWGCDIPTILLSKDNLKFDLQGQRCLMYKKIKDLEEKLGKELIELIPKLGINKYNSH